MEFCTIGLTACCHKGLYIKHGYIASPMDLIVTKLWNAYVLLQTCTHTSCTYEGVMIVRVWTMCASTFLNICSSSGRV